MPAERAVSALKFYTVAVLVYGIPSGLAAWYGGLRWFEAAFFITWGLCSVLGGVIETLIARGYLPEPKK